MAIKSYIRGFGAYPVDTREMISATDAFLVSAAAYALDEDTVTISLADIEIKWEYFGSQVYCVVFYEVP